MKSAALFVAAFLVPAAVVAQAVVQPGSCVIVRPAQAIAGLPPAAPTVVPMCAVEDLSLATDGENGSFNGMNHSGTLVVLRNIGPVACRVPAEPQITFSDRTGPLRATVTMAGFTHPGMGHGPVVLPVVVAPGAELTSTLRWVSGEVYDRNACITPTALTVMIQGKPQTTSFGAHLCGDANKGGPTYEQTRFAPDPVYLPAAK